MDRTFDARWIESIPHQLDISACITDVSRMSDWSKWHLFRDKDRTGQTTYRVRAYRIVDGKQEWKQVDRSEYGHMTEVELRAYMKRLNMRFESDLVKARAAYEFKHTFITQDIIDGFTSRLEAEIPQKEAVKTLTKWLQRCVLHWFVNQLGKPDPIDWKLHDKTWGLALMCKLKGTEAKVLNIWDEPVHPNTIKAIRQIANRFLAYLHERLPREVPSISLDPVTKAQTKLYKAEYKERPGKFVGEEHWKIIEREIDPSIRKYVQMGYYYGLRRSECLAISKDDLYEDNLEVNRQLRKLNDDGPVYSPLKSREIRQVPHWMLSAEECFAILDQESVPMHPSTFSKTFKEELKRLREKHKIMDLDYQLHDLRRSFITRAFTQGRFARQIQLAAGHANIETTMKYAQDDRNLSRKKFVPKVS